MTTLADIPDVARAQGGVFTATQARQEGWTDRQVRRRLTAGRWARVAGDGLALPAPRWTPYQLAVAAHLSWPEAVCSHTTAGALLGFPLPPEQQAHVITDKGHRSRRSIVAHTTVLGPGELVLVGNVPATAPERTAVDCLTVLTDDSALDLWAWLTSRRLLDHERLCVAVGRRQGQAGTPRLRRLLRLTAAGAVSAAEHRLHQLLRRARIRGWAAGVTVSDRLGVIGVVDLLFEAARLVVEVDGYRAHSDRAAFQRDRERQNRLSNAGYRVLRFTWHDLTERPDRVLAQIRAALRATVPPK